MYRRKSSTHQPHGRIYQNCAPLANEPGKPKLRIGQLLKIKSNKFLMLSNNTPKNLLDRFDQ